MTVHVVGGVYSEICVHPRWNDVYGSGGRAAFALASMGSEVVLHSYMDDRTLGVCRDRAVYYDSLRIDHVSTQGCVCFKYLHDMAVPEIFGVPATRYDPLIIEAEKVVRFGMLEGDAIVRGKWAVYDPQNKRQGQPFAGNGSSATHLALIMNSQEAACMVGIPDAPPETTARVLARQQDAEVVIIKMGPQGALVWSDSKLDRVPAYRTSRVWKIGSGDCFVAHFAGAWMQDGRSPCEAAEIASRATAYYSETQGLPTKANLASQPHQAVQLSSAYLRDTSRQVYLAGPFFDLMQISLLEQARVNLTDVGLRVFSPYHDIGLGSADDVVSKDLAAIEESDVVFAILDGLDPGTVFETGYARAIGKPVIVYSERNPGESLKMMEGSGCILCADYTTAIYSALWEAARA